ncbi:AglZ/HisF2 family acetamidino modification protein [Enterovibrio norvegicus]|uniref:AglZ/HisF2 family acetamidino modification protein n=1 Tax=Enterovibrio norvegicus TaxID=188144 RepID=UPI0010BF5C0D|nr:AglZ/HisF2 family acetamidino modification protein [Enterovibrio norvegicus]TKF11031.1 imidazole glycerol phosphate synthase cyclase subunit [Enterovibrio norvegicus]TKF34541.1 imidazole glycerol phosphate synthase cyclase subunit [Enterovibrio norvegicus]
MLRSRIIPVLLVRDKGLIKTTKFSDDKYVGDPLNAVRIFNEKEADELMIVDIDATVKGKEPDYQSIENWAAECRMPLCYGGGVKNVEQALKILSLGIEKVALSSAVIERPELIKEIASRVGNQSVVAVLDVKKKLFSGYKVYTHNGNKSTTVDLFSLIKEFEKQGVGEVIINNIDADGTMAGYDTNLLEKLRSKVKVPLTYLGGAGSHQDLKNIIDRHSPIGIAAGSLFVFKGKYRAVLINYPNLEEKNLLFKN